jgi:hypothetical protein
VKLSNNFSILIAAFVTIIVVFGNKIQALIATNTPTFNYDEKIEEWATAAFTGGRFDEVTVSLDDCVLTLFRSDSKICSISTTGHGIFETTEVINLSKLDGSKVRFGESNPVDGKQLGQVNIWVLEKFYQPISDANIAYDDFRAALTLEQRESRLLSKVEPIFTQHQIINLPSYSTSDECLWGEHLDAKGKIVTIWVAGPDIGLAPEAFRTTIQECNRK